MSGETILSGTLSDADLPSVLGVTSLGRQTIRLEVFAASGALIGQAVLKAGRVLSATAGVHTGRAALKVILSVQNTARFRISREEGYALDGEPVAMVDDMLRTVSALPSSVPTIAPAPASVSAPVSISVPVSVSASVSAPTPKATRIRVMDGSLRDFDVATLLQTVGLGRQYIALDILGADRRAIGSVLVKAGKIISARSGAAEGIAAIRELLESPRDFGFAVYRLDESVGDVEPLGSIMQVLIDAEPRERRITAPAPGARTPVLRGTLSEFDVPTILFTLAVARQYNCIELYNQEETVGTIYAKAGMVISAATPRLEGLAAFRALVHSPSHLQFSVFRVNSQVVEQPLGSIYQLLSTADEEHAASLPAAPTAAGLAIPEPRAFTNSDRLTVISNRVAVMVGSTTDFSVRTLLETLTEIRQRTVIELLQADTMIGSIHVKAGRLLAARTETLTGIPAFRWLLSTPGHLQFRVFRNPGESPIQGEPLGSLLVLLSDSTAAGAVAIGLEPEMTHRARARVPRYVWIATGIVAAAAGFLLVWRPPQLHSSSVASTDQLAAARPDVSPTVETPASVAASAVTATPIATPAAAAEPAVAATAPVPAASATAAVGSAPAVGTAAKDTTAARSQSQEPVRKLSIWKAQAMLRKLGFGVGPIDNIYGHLTKTALQDFQRDMNLTPSGLLDDETTKMLLVKSPLKD